MNDNMIRIGMAEYKVARAPAILCALGIGSCVVICMYDPVRKIGGMAHVMLPQGEPGKSNGGKYANTAIPLLVDLMEKHGAEKRNLEVKIIGGAQMFNLNNAEDLMRIGIRNVETAVRVLNGLGLTVKAASTGGNYGKSVFLDTETGRIFYRTAVDDDVEL